MIKKWFANLGFWAIFGAVAIPVAFGLFFRFHQGHGGLPIVEVIYGVGLIVNAILASLVLRMTGERRRAALQLERNRKRLAEAQQVARTGSWEWDVGADRVSWSEELKNLYGLASGESETTRDFFLERIHPDDRAAVDAALKRATENLQPFSFDYRIVRDDASVLALYARGRVAIDQGGGGVRVIGTARDVTELKKAERALSEVEERFRQLVGEIQDYAIFMLDVRGHVASWNVGAQRIIGYSAEEIIGHHFSCFYTSGDTYARKPERLVVSAIAEGRVEDEGWLVRKDGSYFWADAVITAFHDMDGKIVGFSKVVRDLTERKRAEEKIRRAHDALEGEVRERTAELMRSNEELKRVNEARLAFTSMVSHELRTPLSAIKAGIDMVEQGVDGPVSTVQAETLSIVKVNVDRLGRLINNVLDYTRLDTGRLEMQFSRTDMNELVGDVFGLMKMEADHKGVGFFLELPEQTVVAECDADKMKTVVINLVHNAIKFTRETGHVEVRLGMSEAGTVRIEVRDNGIGIPEVELETIFRMFHQSASTGEIKSKGSGVGLAVCKFIVEKHDGTLSVDSRFGEGALFAVTFPAAAKTTG